MNTISDAKTTANKKEETKSSTLYDITINALDGTPIDLASFKGKHLLFVNVASECGFTNKYKHRF